MYETILGYVLMYFVFSMIGWAVESMYRSIGETCTEKRKIWDFKFINSGFNYGPVCPIYGAGGLVFELLLVRPKLPFWAVLLVGMIAADIVEYVTSVAMEKLFNARWWDYSNEFMNLHGRICLKHTIFWGIFACAYVYFVSPLYYYLLSFIPEWLRPILTYIVLGVFLIDFSFTVFAALDVQKVMRKLENLRSSVAMAGSFVKNAAGDFKGKALARYDEFRDNVASSSEKFESWRNEIAGQIRSAEKDITELDSDVKTGKRRRAKKIFQRSNTMSERASKMIQEIKEKWEELKNK